jgi:predicted secreted Zn-dependent protease
VSSKGNPVKRLSYFLILAGLFLRVSPAHPEPAVRIRYEYYDVSGRSAHELRQCMNRHENRWTDGTPYDALTTWKVKSDYNLEEENGLCRVAFVKVSVDIVHKLPRWVNRSEATPELVERWDRYLRAVMIHEEGHKNFGILAASETEKAISGMRAIGGCEELRGLVETRVDDLIDRIKKQEREYDNRTDHGRLQGVVFPY